MRSSIGPYRVIDYVGAGGMGTVYRVAHRSSGRVAAAKVLNAGPSAMRSLERFHNEARILQGLHHPGIAALYEFLDVDGAPCIIMEFVDGETLDQRLRARGPFAVPEALRLFAALVGAVGYIHRRGVTHRDLKANNVKIDSHGAVRLLDFGIATSEGAARLTSTGNVVGTLASLAPEQLRTGRAEPRSDIWALGVLLYEMLTGRMPFEGGVSGFVGERIMLGRFDAPSTVRAELPREIDRIVGKCLRVRPDDRYATADALLADVRVLESRIRPVTPAMPATTAATGRAERPWPLMLSTALATAAVLFFVWALRGPQGTEGPAVTRADTLGPSALGGDARPAGNVVAADMSLRVLNIRVLEGAADVYIDDVHVGKTPYSLRAPLGGEVQLVLRREGCDDLRRTLRIQEDMQETIESMTRCRAR